MRQFLVLVLCLGLAGCAAGYMKVSSYDSQAGKREEKIFTPAFYAEPQELADKVKIGISVVNVKKVEPITNSLLTAVGGLGPGDLDSPATAVVHFKNNSDKVFKINLKKFKIRNTEYAINLPQILLKPGERLRTKEIKLVISTYDTKFNLELYYDLGGIEASKIFVMERQTSEDMKERKSKGKNFDAQEN